jgi:hypothetical protein
MKFSNQRELRRQAIKFENEGFYCDAPRGTKGYYEYWDEQKRRCLEGYSVGDLSITGYHYYYLNFGRIERVFETQNGAEEQMGFPLFYDWDYNYFWSLYIAKNGITEDKYEDLDLDVNIDDLSGGNHMAVIKARRKGYSYKAASMLARNFCLKQNSKNYAMVSDSEYLLGDGLFSKTWDQLAFMEENTPFGQPKLTDQKLKKVSGYKEKKRGIEVEKGTKNAIIGISLKDNPEKAVGKSGELGFFEEAGKFPGLIEAWEACRPSYEQGKYTTGTMIAYGTGGTKGADYEGLEELFFNPENYNVIPIKNKWDDASESNTCSFFVPAYVNLEGFIDNNGKSKVEEAKTYLNQEREEKQESDDPRGYNKHVAQFPFTPREATMRVDNNIFPTNELNSQLSEVISKNKHKALTSGTLYREEGEVKFNPDANVNPIFKFPTPKDTDRRGGVVIKQTPYKTDAGRVPDNMYMICHDPYAHDGSPEGSSLGAAYVIKRVNDIDLTYANCPVASYVGRPLKQDTYNRNLFLLAEYYNAKIAFENNRGNVMEYAKNNNLLHRLYEKPNIQENRHRSRPRTTRTYGLTMSSKSMKNQAEVYIRDWLLEEYAKSAEGKRTLVLNKILDPALLKELANYNEDGNFDRVSALMVGMYYLRQLQNQKVRKQDPVEEHSDFFNRELFPK